jgi:hypothetical protein
MTGGPAKVTGRMPRLLGGSVPSGQLYEERL